MCKSVSDKRDLCREITSNSDEFAVATWKQVEEIIDALEPAKIATKQLEEKQLFVRWTLQAHPVLAVLASLSFE